MPRLGDRSCHKLLYAAIGRSQLSQLFACRDWAIAAVTNYRMPRLGDRSCHKFLHIHTHTQAHTGNTAHTHTHICSTAQAHIRNTVQAHARHRTHSRMHDDHTQQTVTCDNKLDTTCDNSCDNRCDNTCDNTCDNMLSHCYRTCAITLKPAKKMLSHICDNTAITRAITVR